MNRTARIKANLIALAAEEFEGIRGKLDGKTRLSTFRSFSHIAFSF